MPWTLRQPATLSERDIDGLTDVLLDSVEDGASVSFLLPFPRERAKAFWQKVAADAARGDRVVLIAEDAQGICGTVQLVLNLPENQPHRAEVVKMLVHRRSRRQGLGAALMQAVDSVARAANRTLLVLDTVTDSPASRLYTRLGWVECGSIPDYALYPAGGLCGATIYYRQLGRP